MASQNNVLLIPDTTKPVDASKPVTPMLALFDFGSAKPLRASIRSEGTFETTYHYLPEAIRRKKPLSRFTSHNKARIRFDDLPEWLSPAELDAHAVSCILLNLLTEDRFRRITAHIDDQEYEAILAFAQLLSADTRLVDQDAVGGPVKDGPQHSIASMAEQRLRACDEIWVQARLAWGKWGSAKEGHPAGPAAEPGRKRDLARILAQIRLLQSDAEPPIDFSCLLESKLLNRLGGIKQLALTMLAPPENSGRNYALHDRLDHSVGVLEVARLYTIALLSRSGWFRFRYHTRKDGIFLLLAALLHDMGHYPCAHYFEDMGVFPEHSTLTRLFLTDDGTNLGTKTGERCSFCSTPHLRDVDCTLRYCNGDDLNAFRDHLDAALKPHELTTAEFGSWYIDLVSASKPGAFPPRPMFRALAGIVSGPIDADKVHYLVNDARHCNLSIGAALEGTDFVTLLNSLRVPLRHMQGSDTQRHCLGLLEESVYLAQLVLFSRAAMFSKVYWSSSARAVTNLLRFIVIECFGLVSRHGWSWDIDNFIGMWTRGTDDEARAALGDLTKRAEEARRKLPRDSGAIPLTELCEQLYSGKPLSVYEEISCIYPADRVAYAAIMAQVADLDVTVRGQRLRGLRPVLLDKVRSIVAAALQLEPEDLLRGSVLVDVPLQHTSKKAEFPTLALVNRLGFGRPIGRVWNAIERDFEENVRLVRIFLRPGIRRLDRGDRDAIRELLIQQLS